MNRKIVVTCSVVALLLLGGVVVLFYSLFSEKKSGPKEHVPLTGAVEAVPSDAIFLYEAEEFLEILKMTDDRSALKSLFDCIPEESAAWEAALSLHYSSKNRVSPLFILSVPEKYDLELFKNRFGGGCTGVTEKRYSSYPIYKSTVPDISYTFYGRYLIASPSIIIVESSLRHLENNTSIMDNPLYLSALAGEGADGVIHLNHHNLGKFFSGVLSKKSLGYAEFFRNFAEWSAFGVKNGETLFRAEGAFAGKEDVQDFGAYSSVLLSLKENRSEVFPIVPNDANFVLTLSMDPSGEYRKAYRSYLESNRKIKDYDYINHIVTKGNSQAPTVIDFATQIGMKEIALFSVGSADNERVIAALRAEKAETLFPYKDSVAENSFRGYLAALAGPLFRPSSDEYWCRKENWVVFGSKEDIDYLHKEYATAYMFNFEDYLSQTPAAEEMRKSSLLSLYINAGRYADTVAFFFKPPYRERVREAATEKNFSLIVFSLHRHGTILEAGAGFYREDLQQQPVPLRIPETGEISDLEEENVSVEIPSGPFRIKNFVDGSANYLEQLPNYDLRLLDKSRRAVWTVKFDLPLCGTVRQIDYLKNNKLQMLFGAGNRIWLLDRLGRRVGKYPVSLEKEILLGPDVYDFSGKKDYTLMVLHTDNTLEMYNLDGTHYSGWNQIKLNEKILSLPEKLEVGEDIYWVVRTSYRTLIYNMKGILAADFSKKRALKKDTSVEVISSSEVAVTAFDGRDMILDLKSGTFRKRQ